MVADSGEDGVNGYWEWHYMACGGNEGNSIGLRASAVADAASSELITLSSHYINHGCLSRVGS